jgi:hypothetical protein
LQNQFNKKLADSLKALRAVLGTVNPIFLLDFIDQGEEEILTFKAAVATVEDLRRTEARE